MSPQNMLIIYEDHEEEIPVASEGNMPHLASALLDLGLLAPESFKTALDRAMKVLLYMHAPLRQHIRQIYTPGGTNGVDTDYALSDLALFLLLMNGDEGSAAQICTQAYALSRAFRISD